MRWIRVCGVEPTCAVESHSMSAPDSQELLLLLERRLGALKKSRADLEPALSVQEQLIRTALTAARAPKISPFPLPRERAIAQIRHGVPLLHDQPAEVDVHFAADLFSRLVNVLQQREDVELRVRLDAVIAAATGGALDPERLFGEAFVQHPDHLAELAEASGVD